MPDDLTAAETGHVAGLPERQRLRPPAATRCADDPLGGHPWGPERSVRARIVCLAAARRAARAARPGLLAEAGRACRSPACLDLAGGTVTPYVELQRLPLREGGPAPGGHFTTLRLVDCSIPRLEAARLHTEGDLHLPRCRIARGIRLTDAQIGTDLLLSQADRAPRPAAAARSSATGSRSARTCRPR